MIALLLALLASSTVHAAPDHVLLARISVSESTWITPNGSNADEARVLYLVLRDRADRNGWTLRHAMQRYSPRATGTWRSRRTARGLWVSTLDADLREPAGWPQQLSWTGDFRWRWEARLAEAEAILASPPFWEEVCDAPPNFWGGRMDMTNPLRFGWRRVDCGRMHNIAWCAPRMNPACREMIAS